MVMRMMSALIVVLGCATWATAATATARGQSRTGIQWQVTPGNVEVFLDGRRLGKAAEVDFTATKPGMHTVRLAKEQDETELDLRIDKGTVLRFRYEFST